MLVPGGRCFLASFSKEASDWLRVESESTLALMVTALSFS